jgi:hypothetical protein
LKLREHYVIAAMCLTGLIGLLLLRLFDPATSGIFPPCPLRYVTGWYCPGCGSLRAIHALLHGDLRQAWAMNPLTVLFTPFIAYGLASQLHRQIRGSALPSVLLPAAWIRALCAVIVLFGIVRNLPLHPFDLLAPGAMLHL